eukprot:gene17212-18933_t
MDDRGPLQWCLGIDFQRSDDGSYVVSQQRYSEAILKRFEMTECKPASTPAEQSLVLLPRSDDEKLPSFPYRQAIGSLVYLATATRPDLSWIVSKLSQHLHKPSQAHIAAVKRVLRYVKGTKSTSGFVITLGSAPISWKSQKQSTVEFSSCEAEYIALTLATREIIYLRSVEILRRDYGYFTTKRLKVFAGVSPDISDETVRRVLRKAGFKYSHSRKKGVLSRKDLKLRYEFAKKIRRSLTPSVWTDHVAFYLDGVGFTHKVNPHDQSLAPRTMSWRKPSDGLSYNQTAKGSTQGVVVERRIF